MKNMKRIELEDTFWLIILISRKVKIIMRSYTCNFLFFRKQVSNSGTFWVHHYLRSTSKQQKLASKLVQWTEMIAIFFCLTNQIESTVQSRFSNTFGILKKLSLNCIMSLNRMILCCKWKNGLCKIVTKSQGVTKFNVTKSRLHCMYYGHGWLIQLFKWISSKTHEPVWWTCSRGFNFNGFEGFFAKVLNGNNLDYIFCQTSKWQQTWLICTTSWNSHY